MAHQTPTLDQLFPEPDYSYYTRLNYFPADDESKRRINVEVFKHDPTNYDLKAARNSNGRCAAMRSGTDTDCR